MASISQSIKSYSIVAVALALYTAAWVGLLNLLETAPNLFLMLVAVAGAIIIAIIARFAEPLFIYRWRWNKFASNFRRKDIDSLEQTKANGMGFLGGSRYWLNTAILSDGVLMRSIMHLGQPTALIPWEAISRITRCTVVSSGGKPCEPREVAYLYLWKPNGSVIVSPWENEFDSSIPRDIGFENLGSRDVAL